MRAILVLVTISLIGCAHRPTIQDKISSDVQTGDSQAKVKELLGPPDGFGPVVAETTDTVWAYSRNDKTCEVGFKESKVVWTFCPSAKQPGAQGFRKALRAGGAALQGMGQANAGTTNRGASCVSRTNGNQTFTDCN